MNKPIKLRNAITELWNEGKSVDFIASYNGLSEERVKALLKSARNGHHTPEQEVEAAEVLAAQQAAQAQRRAILRKK